MYEAIHPYPGNEPFLFISYAHKDKTQVMPTIQWLIGSNYRVWFDQGIHSGEFASKIQERLEKASCVIAFLSDNYVNSINCRNEINYAIKKQKMIIPIYLKPTELRYGMELQLVSYHCIRRYQMDEKQFREQLAHSPELLQAHGGGYAWDASVAIADPEKKTQAKKKALGIVFACLAVFALCVVGVLIMLPSDRPSDRGSSATADPLPVFTHTPGSVASGQITALTKVITGWKPLEQLGHDKTIYEALTYHYGNVSFGKDTVTAGNGEKTIQFSLGYGIDPNGDFVFYRQQGDSIFYDCYQNGSPVDAVAFEKYLYELIMATP